MARASRAGYPGDAVIRESLIRAFQSTGTLPLRRDGLWLYMTAAKIKSYENDTETNVQGVALGKLATRIRVTRWVKCFLVKWVRLCNTNDAERVNDSSNSLATKEREGSK